MTNVELAIKQIEDIIKDSNQEPFYDRENNTISFSILEKILNDDLKPLTDKKWHDNLKKAIIISAHNSNKGSVINKLLTTKNTSQNFYGKDGDYYTSVKHIPESNQLTIEIEARKQQGRYVEVKHFLNIYRSEGSYYGVLQHDKSIDCTKILEPIIAEIDSTFRLFEYYENKYNTQIESDENGKVTFNQAYLNSGQFKYVEAKDLKNLFTINVYLDEDMELKRETKDLHLKSDRVSDKDIITSSKKNIVTESGKGSLAVKYKDILMLPLDEMHPIFQQLVDKEYLSLEEQEVASTPIEENTERTRQLSLLEQQIKDIENFITDNNNLYRLIDKTNKELNLPALLKENLKRSINNRSTRKVSEINYKITSNTKEINFVFDDEETITLTKPCTKETKIEPTVDLHKSEINRLFLVMDKLHQAYGLDFTNNHIDYETQLEKYNQKFSMIETELEAIKLLKEMDIHTEKEAKLIEEKANIAIFKDKIDNKAGLTVISTSNGIFDIEVKLGEDMQLETLITPNEEIVKDTKELSLDNVKDYIKSNKNTILQSIKVEDTVNSQTLTNNNMIIKKYF